MPAGVDVVNEVDDDRLGHHPGRRSRMEATTSVLPERRTSLVGRDTELESIAELIASRRLVTLTGAGGVGKSSVAMEAGRRLAAAGTEVFAADVLAAASGSDVVVVFVDQLGLAVDADRGPLDALVGRLNLSSSPLLVLDNCENRVDEVADLVDELLTRCPALRILATSVVRLDVDGEVVLAIGPLPVTSDGPGVAPAVQLLIDRTPVGVGAPQGHERRLIDLATRLDGVPLALELAAARLTSTSIDELLGQLDGELARLGGGRRQRDGRHRSVGAVVDWSLDLLGADEQQLLCRLSVFTGGFNREAAEVVAGPGVTSGLHELVEVSLLERLEIDGATRYRMLETVRALAAERLGSGDEYQELAARHATWAADWALTTQVRMRGPEEPELGAAFSAELPNVGAALRWAAANNQRALVGQLARSLGDHLYFRSSAAVHAWIDHALAVVPDPFEIEELLGMAILSAQRSGELDEVERLVGEAEARGYEGRMLLMGTEAMRGAVAGFRGRLDESHERLHRFAEMVEDENAVVAVMAYGYAALPLSYQGDYEGALAEADRAAGVAQLIGWPSAIAAAAYVRGEALIGIDPAEARESYLRCLRLSETVDNRFFQTVSLVSLASAVARRGDPGEAFGLFAQAVDFLRSMGAWSYLSTTLRNFGELLVRVERYEESVVIRAAVEHLPGSTSPAGVDADRDVYIKALLRDRLLPARYAELVREGSDLSHEQVVSRATEVIRAELEARGRRTEIRAVVFTDLQNATSFMAEKGDHAARAVMRRYEELTEELLRSNGGIRVKGTGDGMLMTFAAVSDALACTRSLLQRIDERPDELPLRVRVGVHAGEMIDETRTVDGDDIHGTVVNLTARVVDVADGGEVVVTDTARHIAAGSDFDFTPLGEFEMKGIPQPVRLHRFEWSGPKPADGG